MMADCQWERFKATRAPMHSQQRQIGLCQCSPCQSARTVNAAKMTGAAMLKLKPSTKARLDVLKWKPEPPPEPERAA